MTSRDGLFSPDLERALRAAACWHRDQVRRGSGVPYVQHVVAVGLVLDRLGFLEHVVIAGLLHDAVEDTDATLDQIASDFGPPVADLVAAVTERKLDEHGRERTWIDRKTEYLRSLENASIEARAIALADKLHNLSSIVRDLHDGRPIWAAFHADRARCLWYYRTAVTCCGTGDPRLVSLAESCRRVLSEVESFDPG